MAVAIVSPSVPARATVINSGSLVVNNGIIRVHNGTTSRGGNEAIYVSTTDGFGSVREALWSFKAGDTWLTRQCCYAAGSRYTLYVSSSPHSFTPHLCYRNGIPYGFADLTILDPKPNSPYEIVVETHGTCYEGPLP
jgi:hypothetical protein